MIRPSVARALRAMDREPIVPVQREQHNVPLRRHIAGLLGCLPYLSDPLPEEEYAMAWITTFLTVPT